MTKRRRKPSPKWSMASPGKATLNTEAKNKRQAKDKQRIQHAFKDLPPRSKRLTRPVISGTVKVNPTGKKHLPLSMKGKKAIPAKRARRR